MVNVNHYTPQRVGSYIPLPAVIQRKKACINLHDDACFAWAIVSALYSATQHSDRTSSYPHYAEVSNLMGISFPIQRGDIEKFERLNNISVNIYIIDEKQKFKFLPNRLTKDKKERHVNLLLIEDKNNSKKCHYVWIKCLSRLISTKLSSEKVFLWPVPSLFSRSTKARSSRWWLCKYKFC